jgi:hypothetical protein
MQACESLEWLFRQFFFHCKLRLVVARPLRVSVIAGFGA